MLSVHSETHDDMNVGRSVRMAVKKLKQLASWTIVWHRVWNRSQAVHPIISIFVCGELCAQIELFLFRILLLIESVRAALPEIDCDTSERLVGRSIADNPVHERDFAIFGHGLDYTCIILGGWRVVSEKWPQDGGFCGFIVGSYELFVGDFIDQPGER